MAVVGVDGCRKGWIALRWSESGSSLHWLARLEELDQWADLEAVALDIPLGLSVTGERRCDQLARARLGRRASTLFNAPPRACLEAGLDYPRANELSRSLSGRGLSRQSFALVAKIREADDYWRRSRAPLSEAHPELGFAHLNAGVALAPKKSWAGLMQRRELLERAGLALDGLGRDLRHASADDVVDAAVCALVARRIRDHQAQALPDPPDFDETGRAMAIHY